MQNYPSIFNNNISNGIMKFTFVRHLKFMEQNNFDMMNKR